MFKQIQDVSWRNVAVSRRKQLTRRLGYTALGSMFVCVFVSVTLGVLCMAAITASQLLDERIWRPVAQGKMRNPDKSKLILFSVAQASFVFDAVPIALWSADDIGVKILSAMWMAGALLHTTMHMHYNRVAWLAGTGPHMLVFATFPIASYLTGELALTSAALTLFGVLLYSAHMLGTFRAVNENSKAREASRMEALKQREDALAANNAKSAFLATMSHEIRTPLNGVIGLAEVLCTEDLPEKSARHAETIHSSGITLLQLLNDILDISKVEAGRLELEDAPFNLDDIARKIVNLHTPKAREKSIDLEFEVDSDTARVRMGDEHRVAQILHNLVANAVKFTDRGRVSARIKDDGREGWLRFEVQDTGIGMDEEQAEKIFQPFAQADSTITRKFGGTGLGLSIVQGIVDAMGGRVAVQSKIGAGTTITVAVPLPATTAKTTSDQAGDTRDTDNDLFSSLSVLVVDDNHVNRLVVTSILSSYGVTAVNADCGMAAIDLAKEQKFDLILMDIAMPDMDGVEAMQTIRKISGEDTPPIFAASAHAMKHEVESYMAEGFDGYLTKPITRAALHEALQHAAAPEEFIHAAAS